MGEDDGADDEDGLQILSVRLDPGAHAVELGLGVQALQTEIAVGPEVEEHEAPGADPEAEVEAVPGVGRQRRGIAVRLHEREGLEGGIEQPLPFGLEVACGADEGIRSRAPAVGDVMIVPDHHRRERAHHAAIMDVAPEGAIGLEVEAKPALFGRLGEDALLPVVAIDLVADEQSEPHLAVALAGNDLREVGPHAEAVEPVRRGDGRVVAAHHHEIDLIAGVF